MHQAHLSTRVKVITVVILLGIALLAGLTTVMTFTRVER